MSELMTYTQDELIIEYKKLEAKIIKLTKELEDSRCTIDAFMCCDFVGCEERSTGGTPQKNGLYALTCNKHHYIAEESGINH